MNNSAIRVLKILEYFSETTEPLTVSDISKALELPKTSVFDIVNILAARGFIRRTNDRAKTYMLGAKAYSVGMAYLAGTNLYDLSHPILNNLCDVLGQTCYLAVPNNGKIVYLDKVESSQPIRATCNIGAVNHMYLSGLGKAMLAGMDDAVIEQVISQGLNKRTPTTITTPEGLYRELADIRERGCAYDMGEDNTYVRCTAAPVRDATGNVCAAISVSMLDITFTDEMKELSTRLIIEAALNISKLLGYRNTVLYP